MMEKLYTHIIKHKIVYRDSNNYGISSFLFLARCPADLICSSRFNIWVFTFLILADPGHVFSVM